MTHRIIPAIMSGGAGTRLWPLSTEDKPKQFHALTGPRTMFAETAVRLSGDGSGFSFASPIALCGEKHVSLVEQSFAEAGVGAAAIVVEPAARNTAAVAAVAAALGDELDHNALVLLAPADHLISDAAAFHAAIARAAPFAHNSIVTLGMTPTRPATGYGYIKRGASLGEDIFAVDAFKEKPDEATAKAYLEAGDYLWNGGIFLFSPSVLMAEFGTNPEIRDAALEALRAADRRDGQIWLGSAYAEAPALPLDIAVMERTSRAAVAPCDIGWADVGSWAEVWRLAPRGADGFAILGPAASTDTSKMEASGVRAIAVHGDDLVVVATTQGVLIVPRASAEDPERLRAIAAKL